MDKTGYQKLGRKALYFFIFERSLAALLFLILEIILVVGKVMEKSYPTILNFVSQNPSVDTVFGYALLLAPILFLVALGVAVLSAYVSYSALQYRIDENSFSLETGILGKKEISVPFREIQNVDIDQSFVYRIFGMSNLVILTAGHEDQPYASQNQSEIVLPALDIVLARTLQKYLIEQANVQEVTPAPASDISRGASQAR